MDRRYSVINEFFPANVRRLIFIELSSFATTLRRPDAEETMHYYYFRFEDVISILVFTIHSREPNHRHHRGRRYIYLPFN